MWLLLPFSWGSVHLTSVDAINAPAIDPKYFLIDFDLDVQTNLGRVARKFWHTTPMSGLVDSAGLPTDDVLPLNATDAQWATYIGDNHRSSGAESPPHWHSIDDVAVVDASILPLQFSGHLTATLYAVAERVSETIIGGTTY
ncbi:hypothetical protein O1611_g10360 [Lasiodiplodia mahajangana]|uniref:Uncharacterized protein n=1 Tax=Lasiodiplodia mahajangana TaxID=1108764 RepID=A0ACC2IZ37_9PEZI|nr:hypothetical protein O1611_g10360 [Lasiodiplodia mahajangana]